MAVIIEVQLFSSGNRLLSNCIIKSKVEIAWWNYETSVVLGCVGSYWSNHLILITCSKGKKSKYMQMSWMEEHLSDKLWVILAVFVRKTWDRISSDRLQLTSTGHTLGNKGH